MLYLKEEYYREIAREITQRNGALCGAVELTFDEFELIFGFDFDEGGLDRWILICFERGGRCGSDFDVEMLKKWL